MLNGCIQYEITPKVDKEGKMQESKWFDDQQIELCVKKKIVRKKSNTGGPLRNKPNGYGVK